MNIVGLGTDIVECVRLRSLIDRHGELFLIRVYTKHEICVCRSSVRTTEAFAGRWAAKEAVLKCLGVVERAPHRIDIEIRSLGGTPHVVTVGAMAERAAQLGINQIMLAVALNRKYASATAIAVGH